MEAVPNGIPQPSEDNIEKHRFFEDDVVFLHYCETVKEFLNIAEKLLSERGGKTLMLDEYELSVDDVVKFAHEISRLAQEHGTNVVMAPTNIGINHLPVAWETRREQLSSAGIRFEGDVAPNDGRIETVGFYFGADGFIYAFPKAWEIKPMHRIPETNIGVTICGEIHDLKPEDLEGVDVIYNPSREGDDPYLKYRMLGLANPNISRDEVRAEMLRDDNFDHILDDTKNDPSSEYYVAESDSREARERRFDEWLDTLWHLAREESGRNSNYAKHLAEVLREKRVPIIRCDGGKTSGLLNPMEGLKIEELEYEENHGRMKFRVEK